MLTAGELKQSIESLSLSCRVNQVDSFVTLNNAPFDHYLSHVPSPSAFLVLTSRCSKRVNYVPLTWFLMSLGNVRPDVEIITDTHESLTHEVVVYDGGIIGFNIVTGSES